MCKSVHRIKADFQLKKNTIAKECVIQLLFHLRIQFDFLSFAQSIKLVMLRLGIHIDHTATANTTTQNTVT